MSFRNRDRFTPENISPPCQSRVILYRKYCFMKSTDPISRRRALGRISTLGAAALTGTSAWGQSDEKPLRVAVIGHTGRGDYGHGLDTMWSRLPETELVGVADANESGLQKALTKLSLTPEQGHADYRAMLQEVRPDLVAIGARHVDQHHDMAVAAAEAGVKGIYMEKPFCRDLVEADAIISACDASGTRLALAHRNRYHPALPRVHEMIKDGKIGQLLEIRTRGKEDQRGGPLDLWVLGSHLLNLAHHFAGEPLACYATAYQNGKPASSADRIEGSEGVGPLAGNKIHARFEMSSGTPVYFDSLQNAGVKEAGFGVQLIGTEGVIDFRIDAEPLVHYRAGSPFNPKVASAAWIPITSAGLGQPEPLTDIREQIGGHLAPARDLMAAIKEKREPLCSARDGRVTMEMIFGVFASHKAGGARAAIPAEARVNPWVSWG
jgi:predicted dehydrogenase